MIWETVRLALLALRRNKLRSGLTMLGIVIGVAAVIAMVTVGQGSSRSVTQSVASLGTNVLSVRPDRGPGPGGGQTLRPFTLRDAEALADLPVIAGISPTVSSTQTVVAGGQNLSTTITGATSGYLVTGNWTLLRGRAFSPSEDRSGPAVCIIGETVRRALYGNYQNERTLCQ